MKKFFNVKNLDEVLVLTGLFPKVDSEKIPLMDANGRVLAEAVEADVNLPDFSRSTMDGYAVAASSTFGATDGNPAYLTVAGSVDMGKVPSFSVKPGDAARIATGGMLPAGTDSVVMVEHTEAIDSTTIEIYKSVAPGANVIQAGEDYSKGEIVLQQGQQIDPPQMGVLAAFGKKVVTVCRKPVIGILSTGDEIVPVDQFPCAGEIRDINTYTLSGQVYECGCLPKVFGIVNDDFDTLAERCVQAIEQTDAVLISGGSSVGVRDFTIEAIEALPGSEILFHGISISPGKPTLLARVGTKQFWGLPGHVVSAMVVFQTVVRPFLDHIRGLSSGQRKGDFFRAVLDRNIASTQGRVDYIRVALQVSDGRVIASPIRGKSGLINTMAKADGLVVIGINEEGLDKGTEVPVIGLRRWG